MRSHNQKLTKMSHSSAPVTHSGALITQSGTSAQAQEAHRFCLFLLCELQITKSAPDTKSQSEVIQSETHQEPVCFGHLAAIAMQRSAKGQQQSKQRLFI